MPSIQRLRIAGAIAASVAAVSIWILSPSAAQSPSRQQPPARVQTEYDGPMNKVLLKDYDPHSNLVVPEHHPQKAKFPVIDVHVHPRGRTPEAVADLIKVMDATGVDKAVLLTGATAAGDPVAVLPVLFSMLWHRELVCELTTTLLGPASLIATAPANGTLAG